MRDGAFVVYAASPVRSKAERFGFHPCLEAAVERAIRNGRTFRQPPTGIRPLYGRDEQFVEVDGVIVRVVKGDLAPSGMRRLNVVKIEGTRCASS